jgi:hypothetical protein
MGKVPLSRNNTTCFHLTKFALLLIWMFWYTILLLLAELTKLLERLTLHFLQYYWGNTWSQDAVSLSIQTPHPALPSSFTTFQFSIQNPAHYQWDRVIFWETHPEIVSHSSYVIPFWDSPSARECGKTGMKKTKTWKRMIPQHTWYKNTTLYKITHTKLSVIRESSQLPFQVFTHIFQSFSQAGSLFWIHASHSFSQVFNHPCP